MSDPDNYVSQSSQSPADAKALFKKSLKEKIEEGYNLYPRLTAELCVRHTSNILQDGNPNNVNRYC